jgi:anti-sigma factor RsiW
VEMNLHADEERLENYVLGRLPSSDLPLLEEHLMICSTCRDRLDEVEQFALAMKQAMNQDHRTEPATAAVPSGSQPWLDWFRRPAFSMVLAMVALIGVLSIFSGGKSKIAPVAALQLTAVRGQVPTVAPARELDLTLTDAPRDAAVSRVEIFNAAGQTVWSGLAQSGAAGVEVKAEQRLTAGDYFLRLYSPSGEVRREYGFRIRP